MLKKNKAKSKNDSERFCKTYYELVVGAFFKDMWLVYTAGSVCSVENIGYRVIREVQWELAIKKRGFYPKLRAREALLPAESPLDIDKRNNPLHKSHPRLNIQEGRREVEKKV